MQRDSVVSTTTKAYGEWQNLTPTTPYLIGTISCIGHYVGDTYQPAPRAGSGAVSKWVICACDSLVDFGTV